jgi:glycosyltransferase involved in cell wall biosynthesis
VLFAPDWRSGVPYQSELANALAGCGADVQFASHYRRVLPLARLTRQFRPDILHLHWPEAYFSFRGDLLDALRKLRLPVDSRLACVAAPLVLTAHNLFPHDMDVRGAAGKAVSAVHRLASAVIAHSEEARQLVAATHGVDLSRIFVIPHGDLSPALGPVPARDTARRELSLSEKPVCLMFGRIEPYKGIDEVVDFWNTARPEAELWIVGNDNGDGYTAGLLKRIAKNPSIKTVFRHVPDRELAAWLRAADCVIFNYRKLLTSGAASLARSFGVPLLIPARLNTVDLSEPDPRVFRFQSPAEFAELLPKAFAAGADYAAAESWRGSRSWTAVAEKTRKVYDLVLNGTSTCAE